MKYDQYLVYCIIFLVILIVPFTFAIAEDIPEDTACNATWVMCSGVG